MKTGIDYFLENCDEVLAKRNVVLITGSANVDCKGVPVYLSIKEKIGPRLKAVWALQHGFFIDKQDNMILSDSFYWEAMDIRIKSLYGEKLLPDLQWLEEVDALVVDLLDVGTRVYTFVNHIVMIMKTLSGKGIDLIVLDRPNPLGGDAVEGNVMETEYFSIVGQLPVPMRHGLTTGEYLSFALSYYAIDMQLEVVTARDWRRYMPFDGIWTYPSPNMPTFGTAVVYPGAVMLEGTNISEARGTTRPFEMLGAPFIDNFKLTKELETLEHDGVVFTPVFFKPEFSKFAGEVCKGVLVTPTDFESFRSYRIYYDIMRLLYRWYPENFKWKEPPYEFEYHRPPIDMICGSSLIRKGIETDTTYDELFPRCEDAIREYIGTVDDFLLY